MSNTSGARAIETYSDVENSFENDAPIRFFRERYYIFVFFRALFFFLLTHYFQCVCSITSDQSVEPGYPPPIPDRLHDSLFKDGPMFWARGRFVHMLHLCFCLVGVLRFAVLCHPKASFIIFTRFFHILTVAYIYRGISIVVTTIPSPRIYCVPSVAKDFLDLLKLSLFMGIGKVHECTDMIVSGHTLMLTAFLLIWTYYERPFRWLVPCMWAWAIVLMILLNAGYFHYTVDIIMGFTVCSLLWWVYHTCIEINAERYYQRGSITPIEGRSFFSTFGPFVKSVANTEGLEYRLSRAEFRGEIMRLEDSEIGMNKTQERQTFLAVQGPSGTENFYIAYIPDTSVDVRWIRDTFFVMKYGIKRCFYFFTRR